MLVDWQKPHVTRILLWHRGCSEDIHGCPEDQLGTPASGTPNAEIVKVGPELRDVVGRRLEWRNAGGVRFPETAVVGGVV